MTSIYFISTVSLYILCCIKYILLICLLYLYDFYIIYVYRISVSPLLYQTWPLHLYNRVIIPYYWPNRKINFTTRKYLNIMKWKQIEKSKIRANWSNMLVVFNLFTVSSVTTIFICIWTSLWICKLYSVHITCAAVNVRAGWNCEAMGRIMSDLCLE